MVVEILESNQILEIVTSFVIDNLPEEFQGEVELSLTPQGQIEVKIEED